MKNEKKKKKKKETKGAGSPNLKRAIIHLNEIMCRDH